MAGSKKQKPPTYPRCSTDGSPMVRIGGKLQCAFEYLNRCIGNVKVIDVAVRNGVGYYVFENEHELPMLCPCCGVALNITDRDIIYKNVVGRRLESMQPVDVEFEDGQIVEELHLHFSKRGFFSKPYVTALSPEIASNLKHSSDCEYRPLPKKRLKKKRRSPQ